jgi:hypothetical protein
VRLLMCEVGSWSATEAVEEAQLKHLLADQRRQRLRCASESAIEAARVFVIVRRFDAGRSKLTNICEMLKHLDASMLKSVQIGKALAEVINWLPTTQPRC